MNPDSCQILPDHAPDQIDGQIGVTLPSTEQAIAYFLGDNGVVILGDEVRTIDLPDLFPSPVQRAVAVARLRIWADMIEAVTEL